MNIYLIEFYNTDGDICFAWVNATDGAEARKALRKCSMVDEIIQTTQQSEIFALKTTTPQYILQGN